MSPSQERLDQIDLQKLLLRPDGLKTIFEQPVYWQCFFVVAPFFGCYATLFGLQHHLKQRLGIQDDSSAESTEFGFAISFLYIFNLLFRFLHGVVFGRYNSRGRVFIAMFVMLVVMFILSLPIQKLGAYKLHGVMLIYALGGVAIGTFEPNLLSTIAPLGNETKRRAILGIPVGISFLLISGFFLMGPPIELPPAVIYASVGVGLVGGVFVMASQVPACSDPNDHTAEGLSKLRSDARRWRSWLPQLWTRPLVYILDMGVMAAFSPGVWLYIYDQQTVTVMPGVEVANDSFFAVFNVFNLLGSIAGRWLSYKVQSRHPVWYLSLTLTGVSLMLLRMPVLVPISTFLVMLGDGLIYGNIAKYIDEHVPKEFNLVAISYWCTQGDVGAIIGTNLISVIRNAMVG